MKLMKRLLCGLAVLSLLVGRAGQANADYVFTTIDVPGSTSTALAGINNLGQIVGTSRGGRQARQLPLWIERIDYDGANGTVAITFHHDSSQPLAQQPAQADQEKRL
jgi:hypothetical protein